MALMPQQIKDLMYKYSQPATKPAASPQTNSSAPAAWKMTPQAQQAATNSGYTFNNPTTTAPRTNAAGSSPNPASRPYHDGPPNYGGTNTNTEDDFGMQALLDKMNAMMAQYLTMPQVPVLSQDEAMNQATTQLSPVYADRMKEVMKQTDYNNLSSGFYGQMPGDALKRETAVQEEGERTRGISGLAQQLVGQSQANANTQTGLALQRNQMGLSSMMNAFQTAIQQANSNRSNNNWLMQFMYGMGQDNFQNQLGLSNTTGTLTPWLQDYGGYGQAPSGGQPSSVPPQYAPPSWMAPTSNEPTSSSGGNSRTANSVVPRAGSTTQSTTPGSFAPNLMRTLGGQQLDSGNYWNSRDDYWKGQNYDLEVQKEKRMAGQASADKNKQQNLAALYSGMMSDPNGPMAWLDKFSGQMGPDGKSVLEDDEFKVLESIASTWKPNATQAFTQAKPDQQQAYNYLKGLYLNGASPYWESERAKNNPKYKQKTSPYKDDPLKAKEQLLGTTTYAQESLGPLYAILMQEIQHAIDMKERQKYGVFPMVP